MLLSRPHAAVRSLGLHRHLRPSLPSRPFTALSSARTSKTQVYLSRSSDPYLNLSIEHHLLQTTPSDSTILFLYTNRPCVVVGRNQNPWLEVNLPLLSTLTPRRHDGQPEQGIIELVRRRSGGGTVFHDAGNVNFSVICPPSAFDRDKHAEMVVRALKKLGVPGARVNCRHDIVVDIPDQPAASTSAAMSASAATCPANTSPEGMSTFKVSGSAYKLTRLRSLHHGTCLLSSPNLGSISPLLRSPAEPFIKARGVESVRSPVRNVNVGNQEFEDAVMAEFESMYGRFDVQENLGDDAVNVEGVGKGLRELKSRDWIYGQTPLFTFSTHPTEDDPRERPSLPGDFHVNFEARQGQLNRFLIGESNVQRLTEDSAVASLSGSKIYDSQDWAQTLRSSGVDSPRAADLGRWLDSLFPKGHDAQ